MRFVVVVDEERENINRLLNGYHRLILLNTAKHIDRFFFSTIQDFVILSLELDNYLIFAPLPVCSFYFFSFSQSFGRKK
jgi:hypothetical protein